MKQSTAPATTGEQADRDDLPEGWIDVALEEILTPGGLFDGPFGSSLKTSDYVRSGVRVIRLENLGHLHFNEERRTFISHGKYESLVKHRVHEGDIIFGSFVDQSVRVCVLPCLDTIAIAKADCFCIRSRVDVADRSFLAYSLATSNVHDALLGQIHGATRPRINTRQLRKVEIHLPPLHEQRRIVEKVEQLETSLSLARDRLAKVPKILKALRQSVLAAACSGRLTEDWRETQNASEWESVVVKDAIVTKPRNGLSVRAVNYETNVRSLTLTATTSGRFEPGHFKYLDVDIPPESHLWLKHGDILLQRGNTEEYVGIAALYDGDDDEYIYPDLMIKIRPKHGTLSEYLWMALSTPEARQYFRENATGSQGSMPKINQMIVENAPIQLPSPREQREIVRRVEALFKLADKIGERVAAATKRADKLTQAILAKAFRGELVPTEAELARKEGRDYEPAATLLTRIRAERETAAVAGNGIKRPKTSRARK